MRKKINRTSARLPVRGYVELTYTGNVGRCITARAGQYDCAPGTTVRVFDVDVEALLSLGCFTK